MNQKKFYEEINIARGIGIFLVLLGHSFPDAQTGIQNPFCDFIHSYIYAFHMPLFFLISGFVFAPGLGRIQNSGDLLNLTKKKGIRLLVPYFFYSLVTLALKTAFSAYANNPFNVKDSYEIFLGKTPNGGLWFLWALFMVTLIVALCRKLNLYVLLVISIAVYQLSFFLPSGFDYLDNIVKYVPYFTIGIIMNAHYEGFKSFFSNKMTAFLTTFLCAVLIGVSVYFEFDPFLVLMIRALAGTLACWIIANNLSPEGKFHKLFGLIAKYGMDVYLISYFVQIPIRVITTNFIQLPYFLVFSSMLILGCAIPILLSKYIIKKSRILMLLLTGA